MDGVKIKRKRLFYDGYYNHCRDVYIFNGIVIKIDHILDDGETDHRNDVSNQCKIELKLWKKMSEKERLFFVEPLQSGFFVENGHRVYWLTQRKINKTRKSIYRHKNYSEFEKICNKYNLDDAFERRNCVVDISNKLICFDWAI